MVEIAICLAIIGVALVAIIGVLPLGMRTQRDNREETIINQDATVFLEAIRSGARGLDDLTNYVYAITNYWTEYNANGTVNKGGGPINNGYSYSSVSIAPGYVLSPSGAPITGWPINSGTNIIGLLSTPEYTDNNGVPIPSLLFGGYSNHVVAYVRSLSGPAVEKPPQNNDIIAGDSFAYRILCVNPPIAMAAPPIWQPQSYTSGDQVLWTNGIGGQMSWQVPYGNITTAPTEIPGQSSKWVQSQPPPPADAGNEGWVPISWQPRSYTSGDQVSWNGKSWQVTFTPISTGPADIPGQSPNWAQLPYSPAISSTLHELRLTFLWPQLPNGSLGAGRQTFRTMVAGQMTQVFTNDQWVYFYQPQSFTNVVSAQ